jgi:flagellin-like hook-associated protein FlgL
LLSPFVNGSFEGGTLGSSVVPGWSVNPERVLLDGTQTIAGFPTPVDNRSESLSYMEGPGAYTAVLSNASVAPGSTQSMMLKSSGLVVDSNGVSHGPYIVSDALYVPGGESVSFKWRATGDTDAFDVYAYLLNVDDGSTQPLLNRTGASLTDATSWVTNTTTINQSGNYKFVFVSGSYDLTGGRATGATLFVDDVLLSGSPPTQKPSAAELDRLYQLVQSQSGATGLVASFELQGQAVSSGPSATAAVATAALKNRIDTLSLQGQLQGVAAEVVGGKLRLTSRFPGEPLSLTQLAVSNPIYSATKVVLQAATAGVEQATGLPGAQAQSVGADITTGVPAKEDLVRNAGRLIYQIGANDGDTLEYTFTDFTGEQGFMDALTWDASSRRLSRAQAIASAQGQETVNDAQQTRSQIINASTAKLALELLDEMMQKVDERRSSLGAALNRLQSAGNNVSVGVIEQSSSRSQLQDADYAKSAAALAKNQIIQSAASAVLAQANATNKDILKLLGI